MHRPFISKLLNDYSEMGEMKDPKKLHFKAIEEQKGVSMILYCLQKFNTFIILYNCNQPILKTCRIRMTLYHFANCLALAYTPYYLTYKYAGLAEYGAFWKVNFVLNSLKL